MRASSVWGFLGLAFVFWSLRFSMIWTSGHEEYGPYLVGIGAACCIAAALCWAWPKQRNTRGPTRARDPRTNVHSSMSENQSGGFTFQGERNNYTFVAGSMNSRLNDTDTELDRSKAEIKLVFGTEGPYIEIGTFNSTNIRKTVCVGVKNIGNKYLSNCKLKFEALRQHDGLPETWHRDGPFSLNVGEERYLSVAAYNEPISSQTTPEAWIMLSALPSGTFWRAPMIPAAGGAVTLTATSSESRECKAICKFWVADGKLYWEPISGDAHAATSPDSNHESQESSSDKLIPMPEAAARAYGELRANGSSWAKAADTFAAQGIPETVYFAGALSVEIPIYGKHPPSRNYEVIDPKEFKRGLFKDDGASFHYHRVHNPQFIEIAVKNGDLTGAIERMREKQKSGPW